MKYIPAFLIALFALSLSACSDVKAAEKVRTVDWYRQEDNEADLNAKIAECNNNPGMLKDTPNCINAQQAKELPMIMRSGFEKVKEPDYPTFGQSK